MKVKFVNGAVKSCAAPTEQKIFKSAEGVTISSGWILILKLIGEVDSCELDELLTEKNVEKLEFFTQDDDTETPQTLFTLNGYHKVSSSVIRHAKESSATHTEIQLSKGV